MSIAKFSTVKNLIKALGMTQKEFAEKVQMSTSIISQYVSGDRQITSGAAIKICSKFKNVNFSYLMTGNGDMFSQPSEVAEAVEEVEKLTEENKRLAAELLREREINDQLRAILLRISGSMKEPG